MHKKAHLTHTLHPGEKLLVGKGIRVHLGMPLLEVHTEEIDEFNLAKLLNVPAKKVEKYLVAKLNSHVEKGAVIARKKSLFKKISVKTPVVGTLLMINSEAGIVGIKRTSDIHQEPAWFSGVVKEIEKDKIVFEVEGGLISGKFGQGGPVSGELIVIEGPVTAISLPIGLEKKILVVEKADSAVIAKADALGIVAIVAAALDLPAFPPPYLLVEDIRPILRYTGRPAIVSGARHEMLIVEEGK